MPHKILIAYATVSGSTAEIAETIAETLRAAGEQVEVQLISRVSSLDGFDAVVVGGPIIWGWHQGVMIFLTRYQAALSKLPVAYFMTCANLTQTGQESALGVPVLLDTHAVSPKRAGKYSLKEKKGLPEAFLKPVLDTVPQVKPVQVALLGGKVDYGTLELLQRVLLKYVVRAKAGDFRNWDTIKSWTTALPQKLFV